MSIKYLTANLLPYRDMEKKEQKKQLGILVAISFVFGILISMLISGYFLTKIGVQENRNRFLIKQNDKLEKELEEIKDLREKLKTVLARKDIVEDLQITRSDTVNILNNLIKTIPDNLYIKNLRQQGDTIYLIGITRSQAKIASFIDSLEKSNMSQNVKLGASKSSFVQGEKSANPQPVRKSLATKKKEEAANMESVYEFNLTYEIERKPKYVEEKKNKKEISKNKSSEKGINLSKKDKEIKKEDKKTDTKVEEKEKNKTEK